jgi:hypothetical protein
LIFNKFLFAKHRSENMSKVVKFLFRHKIVKKLFACGKELKKVKRRRFVMMASSGIIKRALHRNYMQRFIVRLPQALRKNNSSFPSICDRNLCRVRK